LFLGNHRTSNIDRESSAGVAPERRLAGTSGLPREEQLGKEILVRHADKDISLCDAISFAVMELRSVRAAFSFDKHFGQYGRFQVLGP
jgi:hypothetical protein